MRDWHPIRIRNIPGSRKNEHDLYIDAVGALIRHKHASQEEIATYLQDIQNREWACCSRITLVSGAITPHDL
jgi:hypothetical protein